MAHDQRPDDELTDEELSSELSVGRGRLRLDPRIAVYSTILLMATFALIDRGDELLTWNSWLVLVGEATAPLLAVALAHSFSEALAYEVRTHQPLTMAVRKRLALTNLQFLYIVIPAAVLAIPFVLFHLRANMAINVVITLSALSLVGWGLYAAHRVGHTVRRRVYYAISYPVAGIGVVLLELLLKKV